jgi:thiamine phosphate synthase YjbQ (UPF0047 family)
MAVHSAELRFSTRGDADVVDVTVVQRVVGEAEVDEGQGLIFVRGSTAAVSRSAPGSNSS